MKMELTRTEVEYAIYDYIENKGIDLENSSMSCKFTKNGSVLVNIEHKRNVTTNTVVTPCEDICQEEIVCDNEEPFSS